MIKRPKDIYLKVSEKYTLPIEIIESIGNIVFQTLRVSLNNPLEISHELPGLGSFTIRFIKFEKYFENFENLQKTDLEKYLYLKNKNIEKYLMGKELYEKIQDYRKDKFEIREKRNNQNETIKSSKD